MLVEQILSHRDQMDNNAMIVVDNQMDREHIYWFDTGMDGMSTNRNPYHRSLSKRSVKINAIR